MANGINNSERFVYEVCHRTFLSLWSLANPQGKNAGKELCDIAVVCNPHIILFSVKDITLKESGENGIHVKRWERKAVDSSVKQLRGAIRWLQNTDRILSRDGSRVVSLPPHASRSYHLVAVACGGKDKVGLTSSGAANEKIAHVLDEQSFYLLLRHLDTITDFTNYFAAKELLLSRAKVIIQGGEENLLALYLSGGRVFPSQGDLLMLENDLWDTFSETPEFQAKLARDSDSYLWDKYIESYSSLGAGDNQIHSGSLSEIELALRVLAKEDRFSRRVLGKALREFIEESDTVRSRCVMSWAKVGYVFFTYDATSSFDERRAELMARCYASLFSFIDCRTVIGMSFNKRGMVPSGGSSLDLIMLQRDTETWPDEFLEKARVCRDELGFFKKPKVTRIHEDEYGSQTRRPRARAIRKRRK